MTTKFFIFFNHICRLSAEDLELHRPTGEPVNTQYLPLRGCQGDGLDGLLRSGSLPHLKDVLTDPDEEDEPDEAGTNSVSHKEQEKEEV